MDIKFTKTKGIASILKTTRTNYVGHSVTREEGIEKTLCEWIKANEEGK